MRAEIVGIPPVPTGLTWQNGTVEFSFDSNWSDGVGRGPGTISGVLHPTTKDKFVVPGSNGALFVPATPTGVGVIRGPMMTVRWWLIDSQGREYRLESVFPDSLLADASNQWNVNSIGVAPTYVTSPGPAPVGVDIATGDARYVRFTSLATTSAVGVVQLATGAEAIATTDAAKAITPATLRSAMDARFTLANLAALQGITAAARAAGYALANVLTLGVYRWDGASTRVTDNVFVVRPTDIASDASAGRWLLIASDVFALTPAAPTVTFSAGQTGTLTLNSAASIPGRTFDEISFELLYNWTPAAATTQFSTFNVVLPAGWGIGAISVGSTTVAADGIPRPSAFSSVNSFSVRNESVAVQRICVIVRLVKLL